MKSTEKRRVWGAPISKPTLKSTIMKSDKVSPNIQSDNVPSIVKSNKVSTAGVPISLGSAGFNPSVNNSGIIHKRRSLAHERQSISKISIAKKPLELVKKYSNISEKSPSKNKVSTPKNSTRKSSLPVGNPMLHSLETKAKPPRVGMKPKSDQALFTKQWKVSTAAIPISLVKNIDNNIKTKKPMPIQPSQTVEKLLEEEKDFPPPLETQVESAAVGKLYETTSLVKSDFVVLETPLSSIPEVKLSCSALSRQSTLPDNYINVNDKIPLPTYTIIILHVKCSFSFLILE